jgi:hypothetical protein
MLKIKYITHPGYVRSRVDGEEHWVSSAALVRLYKVNPKECRIAISSTDWSRGLKRSGINKLIHLYPHSDGGYKKIE